MCESETVTVSENKNGKPYFTCRSETCNTTVNLNGENSTQMLQDYLINDGSGDDPADSDSGSDDGGSDLDLADEQDDPSDQSLGDLLGGDDDE